MAYTRTVWENNVTPLNADNLNNMELGIENAHKLFTELGITGDEFQEIKDSVLETKSSIDDLNNRQIKIRFDGDTGTLVIEPVQEVSVSGYNLTSSDGYTLKDQDGVLLVSN